MEIRNTCSHVYEGMGCIHGTKNIHAGISWLWPCMKLEGSCHYGNRLLLLLLLPPVGTCAVGSGHQER